MILIQFMKVPTTNYEYYCTTTYIHTWIHVTPQLIPLPTTTTFDHDANSMYKAGRDQDAIQVIQQEMHLSGKPSKWRDANYYYTLKLAKEQHTNWSKYTVLAGDFNWERKEYQDPYALQQNPTFVDIGQATETPPR